jgi:hypothetical protein
MRSSHDDGSMYVISDGADAVTRSDAEGGDDVELGEVLEAGGRRERPRRITLAVAAVTAVAAVGAIVVANNPSTGRTRVSSAAASLIAGPSARQLADGRWLTTAFPPILFAYPSTVWDGSALVAFDGRSAFPAQAAEYHPRANRWTSTAPPPGAVGASPVGAWGGGRLVLVARETGFAVAWRPTTNRWTQLPALPVSGVVSLVWAGRHMMAITTGSRVAGGGGPDHSQAQAFILGPRRWIRQPDLPRPSGGPVRDAVAAVDDGVVYVLAASARVHHGRGRVTGSVELLRLDSSGWTEVPGTAGLPESQLSIVSLAGALLVTGSTCPEQTPCRRGYLVSLIRPGSTAGVAVLKPPFGTPYPGNVTGGGSTVVVANRDRSYWIYDLVTSKWRQGPTAPKLVVPPGVYWTPYGVLTGGSLLRPASRARRG